MTTKIDLDKPRWSQDTYIGRAKYFLTITNPLNLLASSHQLEESKKIVQKYRNGEDLSHYTEHELWKAKELYDSAFHPDTGEKMIIPGRMSFQVPGNMFITGCMMTFYKSNSAVIFWQWFNQSFNAVVNYTNRSGDSPIPVDVLGKSYVMATGGALATALTLNHLVKSMPPLVGRLVPFVAVASANCINVPMMRKTELENGITITDEKGNKLGHSKKMAISAIGQVVFSRILMAAPGMVIVPFAMNTLERKGLFRRVPWCALPLQVSLLGFCLTFATPLACAIFNQKVQVSVDNLEQDLQDKIKKLPSPPQFVYYNKGL